MELRVHPTLIPKGDLLADVRGIYNAIFVKGDLAGENLFFGEGAGAPATSSAVASDIVSIAKGIASGAKITDGISFKRDVKGVKDMDEVRTRYYLRFTAIDKPGVLAKIAGILGKNRISIASVSQKETASSKAVPVVMMTHEALERDMAKALKTISGLKAIKGKTVRLRVEG